MIRKINETVEATAVGAKAAMLSRLTRQNFRVPEGLLVETSIYETAIKENQLEQSITELLRKLTKENLTVSSQQLQDIVQSMKLPAVFLEEIAAMIDPKKAYAVRSSGTKEDLDAASFAGQYDSFLNITGFTAITESIIHCYCSMFSVENLSYLLEREISSSNMSMAVIIQEYVDADYSGVAFTVDPVSGEDQTVVIELTEGQGEQLVGGYVEAVSYHYHWGEKSWGPVKNWLLPEPQLRKHLKQFLDIQLWLGYPCDIEFAVKKNQLYLLQVRPITSLSYGRIQGQWTTANFQDGGVSSQVCSPFMWSLYQSVWDQALGDFLVEGNIFKQEEFGSLLRLSYGRPYWNVETVKKAMAKFPGYIEKDFDNELGIKISYAGVGQTTKMSLSLLLPIIKMAFAQTQRVKQCFSQATNRHEKLLEAYHFYEEQLAEAEEKELRHLWKSLVKQDYVQSETTYFQQVYLNTIQQTLFKDNMLKHLNYQEYLTLLGGLDNISHILPYQKMWAISRKILKTKEAVLFWQNETAESIADKWLNKEAFPLAAQVNELFLAFGYHSERELNIQYPTYNEVPVTWIRQIQSLLTLGKEYSPEANHLKQKKAYETVSSSLAKKVSHRKMKKLSKKIEQMRTLLWWREEYRDVSTRYYALIRGYTLKLAELFVHQGIIPQAEDIWMLEAEDIRRFIDGESTVEEMKEVLANHTAYYQSFRNFQPSGDIGSVYREEQNMGQSKKSTHSLQGIGCSQGIVTGTARVIEDIQEIDQLLKGEILVTRFTDTGWTSKFAILNGIVTETGGVLCHAAICAREYGVPCIVCAKQATEIIQTGMQLEINGATGEIHILNEENTQV